MAQQIINVGISPNDKTGDKIRDAFIKVNDNFTEIYPITTTITKTVGIGKDFTLFHDAMIWALTQSTTAAGKIILDLDPGTHLIGLDYFYVLNSVKISIEGDIFGSISNIVLTPDPLSSTSSNDVFTVNNDGDLSLRAITFDDTIGGYGFTKVLSGIKINKGGFANIQSCDVVGWNKFVDVDNGIVEIDTYIAGDTVIRDGNTALQISGYLARAYLGKSFAYNVNFISPIIVINSAGIYISPGYVVFNSTTNIPIGEIQYDGSFIIEDGIPLSHKGGVNNRAGSYQINFSDKGKTITINSATDVTVSILSNLDVNFECTVVQIGVGIPIITPSGAETINGSAGTISPAGQWKEVRLIQYLAGKWLALK